MVASRTVSIRAILISLSAWGGSAIAQIPTSIDTAEFIAPDKIKSPLHTFAPKATTNGFSNSYTITGPNGEHVIEGTAQALLRVREIHGTEILRQRSTVGTVLTSAKNRTLNLVETPIRILGSVGDELGEVETAEDALLFVPVQTGNLIGKFAKGTGEMGVTGLRIIKGAAGTKCSGAECVSKLAVDAWSGLNSLTGKHDVTRRLHAELGTTTETTYQPLKNQVDRISYADAYTGTAYKFGLGVNGIRVDYLNPVVTGTGYANNAEFLAAYQDADKVQNENKDSMLEWGVSEGTIEAFYQNPHFSKIRRMQLVTAVRQFGYPKEQARLIAGASRADSRFNADAHITAYAYITQLIHEGRYAGLVDGAPVAIVKTQDGKWIMPVVADYLLPREESLAPTRMLVRAIRLQDPDSAPEIHIIGTASDAFIREAQSIGVTPVIISPSF